jgi:RNA polymerase sigma-70 factor (ECF subfamily)
VVDTDKEAGAMRPGGSNVDREGDSLLVLRAQSGDVAAFEQLLLRMHGALRPYLNNLAGAAAADDILQEVALKVFRQIKHLREPRVFMAWTFRIATRVAFVHLKKAKQWRELENDPEAARSLATSLSGREGLDSDFLELVGHASPASRAVLLLHYQQHISIEGAAAILDIPVGTAKSRLSYGIAAIRKFVKEKQENEQ